MINPNSTPSEKLQEFYVSLIGGITTYDTDLWHTHEEIWGTANTFEIAQGETSGTFTRDEVHFELGSQTAALRVLPLVRNFHDEQRLELFVRPGDLPAFTISQAQ